MVLYSTGYSTFFNKIQAKIGHYEGERRSASCRSTLALVARWKSELANLAASDDRKLDVANRTEAVARARQLGILP